ncbi:archease [Candidatus Woesearchaeota archaeon]|nr:archease [Candidatus Woesearchaeota archaeon]
MAFRFLPDVAIADIAFEVTAATLEDLFAEAGMALLEASANPNDVKLKIKKEIKLSNTHIDRLLFDWLAELIYLKDAESLLFSKFEVKIKRDGEYQLDATAWGSTIDYKDMELRNDVKAVTMHMFEVKQTDKGWMATVVIDI